MFKKAFFLFTFLFSIAISGFAQDLIFGKFLGSINAAKLAGSSRYKGYEKQTEIIEVTSAGKNQTTTVTFKFNPTAATADFMAHSQMRKVIDKGLITVLAPPSADVGINHIKYQIYFENASVVSVDDTQACSGTLASTVVVKPQRICWIYYNYDRSGKLLPVTTNGFDLKSGQTWTPVVPSF